MKRPNQKATEAFPPFDNRTHQVLRDALDGAEDHIVRTGKCEPQDATDYLTLLFIDTSSDFLDGGSALFQLEGNIVAEIFLEKVVRAAKIRNNQVLMRKCATQLSLHTHLYFPNYYDLLTIAYLNVLATCEDLQRTIHSGVIKLAAADLPGVIVDIRREFRRRGLSYDCLIVTDSTLAGRHKATRRLKLP